MIRGKRFLAAATALTVATICVATASLIERHDGPVTVRAPHEMELGAGPWAAHPPIDVEQAFPMSTTILTPRPVFRHSVIPGGAYSRSELQQAVLRYPEVADHLRRLQVEKMTPARLSRDGMYYVSYKKDGGIYWTSYKLRLPQGEPVLTDGAETIRARCGNRVSEEPMHPRLPAPLEPPEMEFTRVEVPSLPVTPIIQPSGGTAWLPIIIPFIPIFITSGHDHPNPPGPPGPVVPEPTPLVLLAVGLGFVVAARFLLRD